MFWKLLAAVTFVVGLAVGLLLAHHGQGGPESVAKPPTTAVCQPESGPGADRSTM